MLCKIESERNVVIRKEPDRLFGFQKLSQSIQRFRSPRNQRYKQVTFPNDLSHLAITKFEFAGFAFEIDFNDLSESDLREKRSTSAFLADHNQLVWEYMRERT